MTSVSQTIASAQLSLYNPSNGYDSTASTQTYTSYDVSTPISALEATNSGQTAVYSDLGTGIVLAVTTVSAANDGQDVLIPLNSAGISYLNAGRGSQIAVGGALTPIVRTYDQAIFADAVTTRASIRWSSRMPAPNERLVLDQRPHGRRPLTLATSTPADGSGEFENSLSPHIQLYDPSGNLVASGTVGADGRNETIYYTPLLTGAYRVEVTAKNSTQGEYVLSQAVTAESVPPTVATPASATLNPAGTTASLSVLGATTAGEGTLTYNWTTTGTPPAPVSFGGNGSNAAKITTATFSEPGTYNFTVTITDLGGLTATSSVSLTVNPTPSTIVVSPPSATLAAAATQQFTGVAYDQFGNVLTAQPPLTWSLTGGGSIDGDGLFTPPYSTGSTTIQVSSGLATGTASATFSAQANWSPGISSSWNSSGCWHDTVSGTTLAPPGLRGVAGDTVMFSSPAGGTITLDGANPSVAGIAFDNASASYTVSQGTGGALHLDNGGNCASITVLGCSHVIIAPVVLDSSVLVAPASGSSLTISGAISGGGASFILGDQGTVILSGTNSFTGGIVVTAGGVGCRRCGGDPQRFELDGCGWRGIRVWCIACRFFERGDQRGSCDGRKFHGEPGSGRSGGDECCCRG